jgi:hypothetical protein
MRVASRLLVSLGTAVLTVSSLAPRADALPVVYTGQGTLALLSGTDALGLDGATLVVVATADTGDAPAATTSDLGLEVGHYDPATLTATFSNRPGGAPDVMLSYASQLNAANRFLGALSDSFFLASDNASFGGTSIVMPFFAVTFLSQGYFPGVGVPSLPLFAPADLASLSTGSLNAPTAGYGLSSVSFTATVPEPGVAVGVVFVAGVLAWVERRR